ncbi:hypothetical protein PoB_006575600 [Plakobranchus ocellatus]|uniref:Uncharacterized protein n=1 Tax=Plakobranchus ocellatus TaxID=259542 RepID=A0AAV4D507_9GAST|nr:hypothetical protein PoB_006575600 [Plakobranchus ocellatus]
MGRWWRNGKRTRPDISRVQALDRHQLLSLMRASKLEIILLWTGCIYEGLLKRRLSSVLCLKDFPVAIFENFELINALILFVTETAGRCVDGGRGKECKNKMKSERENERKGARRGKQKSVNLTKFHTEKRRIVTPSRVSGELWRVLRLGKAGQFLLVRHGMSAHKEKEISSDEEENIKSITIQILNLKPQRGRHQGFKLHQQ